VGRLDASSDCDAVKITKSRNRARFDSDGRTVPAHQSADGWRQGHLNAQIRLAALCGPRAAGAGGSVKHCCDRFPWPEMRPPGNCAEGDHIVWRLVRATNESAGLAGGSRGSWSFVQIVI
jgi:hypothetical protein